MLAVCLGGRNWSVADVLVVGDYSLLMLEMTGSESRDLKVYSIWKEGYLSCRSVFYLKNTV